MSKNKSLGQLIGHSFPRTVNGAYLLMVIEYFFINSVLKIIDRRRIRKGVPDAYFGKEKTGNWKEAGCKGGWEYFSDNILKVYSTAIRLEVFEIQPALDVSIIRHRTKQQRTWKGSGFTPAVELYRYAVDGIGVLEYF